MVNGYDYNYKPLSDLEGHEMSESQPRKGRTRREQEAVDLVQFMLSALHLTKYDAEREGFKYGAQSNVHKAIRRAEDYLLKKSAS